MKILPSRLSFLVPAAIGNERVSQHRSSMAFEFLKNENELIDSKLIFIVSLEKKRNKIQQIRNCISHVFFFNELFLNQMFFDCNCA